MIVWEWKAEGEIVAGEVDVSFYQKQGKLNAELVEKCRARDTAVYIYIYILVWLAVFFCEVPGL